MQLDEAGAAGQSGAGSIVLRGTVQDVAYVGTYARVALDLKGTELVVHVPGRRSTTDLPIGSEVGVRWSIDDHLVLPDDPA